MSRALVLSEHDLGAYRAAYARGETPSALPYGVDALERHGVTLAGAGRSTNRVATKLRDVVEHRSGLPVERALRGVGRAARSDVVLALLERQGMLPALLKRAHVPPYAGTPLVIWSCWLADDARTADAAARERLRRRVAAADLVTHMSAGETEILVGLGIPEERLSTIPFGISDRFYTPSDVPRDLDVLAVGQDRGRDYATLLAAVRGTGLDVHVVCRPENLAGLDVPDEVTVHAPVGIPAYRDLLRRARVVAVPTHDLAYPTGQSVALEASATGACVVATGTAAMAAYVEDGVAGRLVPVGDVDGWRRVLAELREDEPQRARLGEGARIAVRTRFNADRMWAVVLDAMRGKGLLPANRR